MTDVSAKNYIQATKTWLESCIPSSKSGSIVDEKTIWNGGSFNSMYLVGMNVVSVELGRVLCTFCGPVHLTDDEGNWQAGAIATLIDVAAAAAIMTTQGIVKVSVDFDITYFHLPKFNEEVEIEARILEHKGKLTAMVLEIRMKRSRQLVAVGRQWMISGRPLL